jgi:phenylalanyl-tRNA synthetase beta chain
MNILASYNWIKEYLDTDLSAEVFAAKTTAIGNSVEMIENVADRFENMVVGDVVKLEVHPNADKLKIALTDIGGKKVRVVCGGENLEEGQKVVVGLPGAKVRWHGEGDLIELKESEIRGEKSHGMICAASEIGFEKLPQEETDIWDISALTDAKAGTPIAKALGLDDILFDIEATTNRPDCKSIVGQAREGVAVTGAKFEAEPPRPAFGKGNGGFTVDVKDKALCPRYTAVVIDGVTVGPSPWWLQKRLLLSGHRPINNIVDVTNYVLHEFGQPLHTFDADKLAGEKIVVRKAKKGEKMVALDGEEYELTPDMLVVADSKKPVAVAGVMGGLPTGTTEETTKVVIECAAFDSVSVRRTSRALNLYSDSQLLFEKGLSTEALDAAMARAIELIIEVAGGVVVSDLIDERAGKYKTLSFPFDPEVVNQLIGIEIETKEQTTILESLGFEMKGKEVVVPYWRDNDIEASVDLTEEIARVYGYENLPSILPEGALANMSENVSLVWQRRVKDLLAGAGLVEVYSYAFISEQQLERYSLPTKDAVKLRNPLSKDHEYMRPSLVPSMLTVIEENQARDAAGDLFEFAPVYHAKKGDIPDQPYRLLLASYGQDGAAGFVRAKGMLERLFDQVGINNWDLARDADETLWHAGRSASVIVDGKSVGVIGQVRNSVAKAFGLDVSVVLVDLDIESLIPQFTQNKSYTEIPQFQEVKRDLAFVVPERTEFAAVREAALAVSELETTLDLFDVYRGKGVDDDKKSLAIHMTFRSDERTLGAAEVDEELSKIRGVLVKKFGAIMRS